jgi:hypothetical protein
MLFSEGLVGPKPIPTGGGDGQQVNIPAHRYVATEGRSVVLLASYWIGAGALRMRGRQIRRAHFNVGSELSLNARLRPCK